MKVDCGGWGVLPFDNQNLSAVRDRPLTLAYIGDAVWELYVRRHLLAMGFSKPHDLQKRSVRYVSAKAQAEALGGLMSRLTDEEREIVRRGRNAKSKTVPKNTEVIVYHHSTALEALIGHHYLGGRMARLDELIGWAIIDLEREGNAMHE